MESSTILEPVASSVPPAEEALYEVVNGQRVELSPMSAYAVWVATRLGSCLLLFSERHALGTVVVEMLFILDVQRNLRRRPDVAFVSSQRWPLDRKIPKNGDWQVVPDLAVEIVSPNDLLQDVMAKMREYFRVGVSQVWIVLPEEEQVYVYTAPTEVRILGAADELEGGSLLPGFRLSVATLFRRENPVEAAPSV